MAPSSTCERLDWTMSKGAWGEMIALARASVSKRSSSSRAMSSEEAAPSHAREYS